jgi:hypothetical protein
MRAILRSFSSKGNPPPILLFFLVIVGMIVVVMAGRTGGRMVHLSAAWLAGVAAARTQGHGSLGEVAS